MIVLDGYTENAALLLLTVGLPVFGALMLPFFHRHAELRDAVSITVSLALCIVVSQLVDVYTGGGRPRLHLWEFFPGFSLVLSLRPLGVLFAATAAFLWVATTFYSIGYMRKNKEHGQTRFFTCFALSIAMTMGIALADNLFTLFIFYELLTLITYPLVVHHGDAKSVKGARKYLLTLLGTSLGLFLPAILVVQHVTGTLDFARGGILGISCRHGRPECCWRCSPSASPKPALMPVHRWLPAAMVAPTPVSALLHAVAVVKAGVFSIVTIILYIFGYDNLRLLTEQEMAGGRMAAICRGFHHPSRFVPCFADG